MNKSDKKKNSYKLQGTLARHGFVRWFHAFRGIQPESGVVRTFFVEYQILNPGIGGDQVILGHASLSMQKRRLPSYFLVKAGILPDSNGENGIQISNYYPVNSLKSCSSPFILQCPDCFYSETHLQGSVASSAHDAQKAFLLSDAGTIAWNLEVHKAVSCNMGFVTSPIARALGVMTGYWHAEGLHTLFKGYISLNGVIYQVEPESCFGFSDKTWGRKKERPLLLLTGAHITDDSTQKEYKNSAFVVRVFFPKLFFLPFRHRLMIQLTHRGEDFEFHFASFKNLARCRWNIKDTAKRRIWHIKAQSRTALIKISICCTKKALLQLLYHEPDGVPAQNSLFCGADGLGTIRLYRRKGKNIELIDALNLNNVLCAYEI